MGSDNARNTCRTKRGRALKQNVEIDPLATCSQRAGIKLSLNLTNHVLWRGMNLLRLARERSAKRRSHRIAVRLFGQVGIARKKLVEGRHDLAALQSWVRAVDLLSPSVPFQERPLAKALAMTSATILMPGSSPFQADSSPCADVSGPSAWAAEAISVTAKTPMATLYNLFMPANYARIES
jgi:hypothetical protein